MSSAAPSEAAGGGSQEQSNISMLELEETVGRLSSHKGVKMVLILNRNGDIVAQSTKDSESEAKHVRRILETATQYVRSLSEEDEISFLQMKTSRNRELYIAPLHGYVLAVVKA